MQGAFVTAPRKNVVGMCLKSTNPYSLSRLARRQSHHACFPYASQSFPLRCETSSRSYVETLISPFRNHVGIRHISWLLRLRSRAADPNGVPDDQEDLTKAAILEKVMKGRQPTDLMLRCASLFLSSVCLQLTRCQALYSMLKVFLSTPSACIFVYMMAHSRKCQDDIWSLQKVQLDCGARIKCM